MFGRFIWEDKIREILHRFGPRKEPMADERPFSEWRKEGEARRAASEEEKNNKPK